MGIMSWDLDSGFTTAPLVRNEGPWLSQFFPDFNFRPPRNDMNPLRRMASLLGIMPLVHRMETTLRLAWPTHCAYRGVTTLIHPLRERAVTDSLVGARARHTKQLVWTLVIGFVLGGLLSRLSVLFLPDSAPRDFFTAFPWR